MNIDQARQDVQTWIETFVEAPHPALAGWPPCPYARKARLDGTVDIRAGHADPYTDLRGVEMTGFEVIAYVYDPEWFDPVEFNHLIDSANENYLSARDIIALADHPEDVESVNGVIMNQGQWAIAFVQCLSDLNTRAKQLATKGFYDTWPEPYLETLFHGREDPRS